jgi:cysteinyl-tRNA synthetase
MRPNRFVACTVCHFSHGCRKPPAVGYTETQQTVSDANKSKKSKLRPHLCRLFSRRFDQNATITPVFSVTLRLDSIRLSPVSRICGFKPYHFSPMTIRLFNSLSRTVEPFTPLHTGKVGMYVCGMTVYDLCHIGHARMMMAFDVIQRWFRASGYAVTYVRNITDIDDKIIKRAVERGITIRALTDEMVQAMHQDTQLLGIEPPDLEPRATDFVPQMLSLIAQLQQRGLAYASAQGDMNFAVRKFDGYGKLSGKSIDELRAGERVAVQDDKHDPLDFVLWKAAKPEEPNDAKWSSPFGQGRPGWHIECSAMSCATLGETFDLHGGGADLQFPHHENEIAQSEGASGKPLARYWVHNGFVRVDNEKMSKSLGNFFTIREVLAQYDPETVRFFMVRVHYRTALNYSDTHIDDARGALKRLYTALSLCPPAEPAAIDWANPFAARFKAAMDEDFGTPEAVAVLFEMAAAVNRNKDAQLAGLMKRLGGLLGILQGNPEDFLKAGAGVDAQAIAAAIAHRTEAKASRNFQLADQIRQDLLAKGIVLKDSANGTTWEVAS